jgi:hypothetical protein
MRSFIFCTRRQILLGRSNQENEVGLKWEGRGKVLVGKPKGKRPRERPRCRWKDGIRMDLREIGWGSV